MNNLKENFFAGYSHFVMFTTKRNLFSFAYVVRAIVCHLGYIREKEKAFLYCFCFSGKLWFPHFLHVMSLVVKHSCVLPQIGLINSKSLAFQLS